MIKLVMLVTLVSSLFAVEAKVKKADVVLSIDTKEVSLKKGSVVELTEGTTVCFVSGKGKFVIPALKKQLKKPKRCLMIPISQSELVSYTEDIKNKLTVAFWDSSESVRHGSGTKGETEYDSNENLVVSENQKELFIMGEFGPLDVLVVLRDSDGEEVLVFENSDSDVTIVRIAKEQLKSGMKLEIYNGFEDLLLSKNIVVE